MHVTITMTPATAGICMTHEGPHMAGVADITTGLREGVFCLHINWNKESRETR